MDMQILDLLDRDGYFLTSYLYDMANFGMIMYVDREGYLYTNLGAEPIVPGVTKWKVDFE